MYNGWTPSTALKARMAESLLQDNFRHILYALTIEAEADHLRRVIACIDASIPHNRKVTGEMSDIDRWGENEALYRDMIGGN